MTEKLAVGQLGPVNKQNLQNFIDTLKEGEEEQETTNSSYDSLFLNKPKGNDHMDDVFDETGGDVDEDWM